MAKARILVVEDESIVAEDLKRSLKKMGYEVPGVESSGEEAVKRAEELRPDLILMDIVLRKKMNGINAAGQIRSHFNIPVIYLTAFSDDDTLQRAKLTEPYGYLVKPFDEIELKIAVEVALVKHRSEEKLRESENLYRSLVETTKAITWEVDIESLRFRYISPQAERILGYKAEMWKDFNFWAGLIHPDDREQAASFCKKQTEEGRDHEFEYRIKTSGGEFKWIRDIVSVVKENGKPVTLRGYMLDISDIKTAEAELNKAMRDWEETFDSIADMVTVHDEDFNIIRANPAAEEILKLPDLLTTKAIKCFSYYHGTDCPPEGCPSCDCLQTGKPASFELFEPHLNKFIEIRAMPRFNDDGKVIGLIHVVRDITERRSVEDAIRKGKIEWEMTFDNTDELIILTDENSKIIRANRSFAEFVDMPVKDISGRSFSDLVSPELKELISGALKKTKTIRTADGYWLHLSVCPVLDDEGVYHQTIIVGTDITSLKITQADLRNSEVELKKKVKDLEKFYKMAVGRELKMKELKKEIKNLKSELSGYRTEES